MATVAYATVLEHQVLPVDAQDVVTRARIVVAGNRAGWEPAMLAAQVLIAPDVVPRPRTLYPLPVTFERQSALHSVYGATRSFGLPEGVDPFLPPEDPGILEPVSVLGFDNPGSPSAIRDGDPLTFATSDLSGTSQITWRNFLTGGTPIHGFRLVYSMDINPGARSTYQIETAPGLVTMVQTFTPSGGGRYEARYAWPIHPSQSIDQPYDFYAIAPHDARGTTDNTGVGAGRHTSLAFTVLQQAVGGELRVFAFYPLQLNAALLTEIADAQIRVPAQNPRRVTIEGYVAPDREHTITGWPGGDFTGVVAQHQYDLGRTVIDFEQAASPLGLPAEMVEAERARRAANRADIATAGYPVLMGQRL